MMCGFLHCTCLSSNLMVVLVFPYKASCPVLLSTLLRDKLCLCTCFCVFKKQAVVTASPYHLCMISVELTSCFDVFVVAVFVQL